MTNNLPSGDRTAATLSRLRTGLASLTRFHRWALCLTAAVTAAAATTTVGSMYTIAGGYQGGNPLATVCAVTLLALYPLLTWTAPFGDERPCPDAVGWALWWTVAVFASITACATAYAAPSGQYIDARQLALLGSLMWIIVQTAPLVSATVDWWFGRHRWARAAGGDGQKLVQAPPSRRIPLRRTTGGSGHPPPIPDSKGSVYHQGRDDGYHVTNRPAHHVGYPTRDGHQRAAADHQRPGPGRRRAPASRCRWRRGCGGR